MQNAVDNATIRDHALGVTRQHWGKILLMTLIATVIPSIVLGVITVIFNALLPIPVYLIGSIPAAFLSSSLITSFVVYLIVMTVVSALLYPALMLGLYSGLLNLIRGQEAGVSAVFSRLGSCLKGFLLSLYIGLRVWLWMLPGLGVSTLGIIIGSSFGTFVSLVGVLLIYVLVIPAAFRYCMALPALADKPELGVLAAFQMSKEIMNGRKWQCFKLIFLYALALVGVMILISILSALLAKVALLIAVLTIVLILALLFFGVLIQVAFLTFYAVQADSN